MMDAVTCHYRKETGMAETVLILSPVNPAFTGTKRTLSEFLRQGLRAFLQFTGAKQIKILRHDLIYYIKNHLVAKYS